MRTSEGWILLAGITQTKCWLIREQNQKWPHRPVTLLLWRGDRRTRSSRSFLIVSEFEASWAAWDSLLKQSKRWGDGTVGKRAYRASLKTRNSDEMLGSVSEEMVQWFRALTEDWVQFPSTHITVCTSSPQWHLCPFLAFTHEQIHTDTLKIKSSKYRDGKSTPLYSHCSSTEMRGQDGRNTWEFLGQLAWSTQPNPASESASEGAFWLPLVASTHKGNKQHHQQLRPDYSNVLLAPGE